jgi:anti-sigma regulatory factor (Ser/Thr protein kinase)
MNAETLQRSVLPETLPAMQGVQVAHCYLPGTTALDVGGDWFDTITLRDGRLGFVVGDVVGKGVRAAATMAQLRNGMRAITLDEISPAESVTKLNRLVSEYTDSPFATMAYLTLDPVSHEATIVSAGHLPLLVIDPRGGVTLLEGGRGLPLGVEPEHDYEGWTTILEAGSTVVLYTDGLVERRDRPLDVGLDLLAAAAAGAPSDPNELVDCLVAALLETGTLGDDVAVLAVKLDEALLRPLELILPADPATLPVLRRELERWLERAAIPQTDARDVVLATWEAGTNAIEHAQDAREQLVRVHAELIGDRLHVEVADSGTWKPPEERPDRGLGLQLIEALMTFVDIDRSPDGTKVVMERSLTRERVGGVRGE